MHMRYRAAATALLLTATAGMAATGGAAEASGTHHAGAKAKGLTITITSKTNKVKLSDDKIRPGNTMFLVKNADGTDSNGLIQLMRLKSGYDLGQAFADFGNLFGPPDDPNTIDAVNRIDDNVVFYGGMNARSNPHKTSMWAVNLNKAGSYIVVNFNTQKLTTLTVAGHHQKRHMPAKDGFINAETSNNAAGNAFKAGKHNPTHGWMSTTNNAEEPHFVDLEQVKKGTKNSDLTAMFNGQGPPPFVKKGDHTDTGVISPGHSFRWAYDLKKAPYAVMCFWPSKMDAHPHAEMGMHIITRLR
jgi:hypothetical protein